MSERCFSALEIADNPTIKCKSGSTLENFGHLPIDKNYCEIQPEQSIGEKTWAECDNICPPGDNGEYFFTMAHCSKFKKIYLFSLCSVFPTTYFDQISPNLWPK